MVSKILHFLRFHLCHFFVHKITSRLARTLKISTGKVFCTSNPKITFKTSKNQLFLSFFTCLPKFGCGTTKPWKSMWHYWKMKIFFFCVFFTAWTFSLPKMKSCSFSFSSQFKFKNGHFFRVATIWTCCFHWRISKPKPIFLLNQKQQFVKFITIFIFHVAIVNLMHMQKIRSYF